MKSLKKYLIWYYMFSKRLLHKFSFMVLLCLIPIMIPLANTAMSGESGMLKIVLCSEDENYVAKNIINKLMESDSIIRFEIADSSQKAREAVSDFRADAAWIFTGNFDEKLEKFAAKKSKKPVVEVVERSDTIPLQVSREVLVGAVFEDFSYYLHKDYVYSSLLSESEADENKLRENYDNMERGAPIVEIQRLNSDVPVKEVNYLTAPIRGFLSLIVMLCSMAAAMYFLKDLTEGRYDWMPSVKRIAHAFASCLAASTFSGAAVLLALFCGKFHIGLFSELISMLLFIISATGFSLVLCVIFKSPGKLGATIPGIIIVMLVLSPIFFNLKVFRIAKLMLPTYYYLQSTYNPIYYLYTVIYCVAVYAVALVLNTLFNNARKPTIC